jgi:hypothetical protein
MKFNYIFVAVFLFIVSSCSSENEVSQETPKTSKVEQLIEHSKEFEKRFTLMILLEGKFILP